MLILQENTQMEHMYSGRKEKHLNFTAHLSPRSYTAQMTKIQLPLMKCLVVFHGLAFKREGKGKW